MEAAQHRADIGRQAVERVVLREDHLAPAEDAGHRQHYQHGVCAGAEQPYAPGPVVGPENVVDDQLGGPGPVVG